MPYEIPHDPWGSRKCYAKLGRHSLPSTLLTLTIPPTQHATLSILEQVPTGPYGSVNDLSHHVKLWAADPKITPGGFPMGKCGLRPPTASKGQIQRYDCKRIGCRFQLSYELTFEGWVIERWHDHSHHCDHGFCTDVAESMAQAGCHTLPPEYTDLFHVLAKGGDKTAAVMRKLAVKAEMDNVEPTWTKEFIKSKLRAYKADPELDAP